MGIDTNTGSASFLDFYLVGRARGWVAVGFSTTHDMVSGHQYVVSHEIWQFL